VPDLTLPSLHVRPERGWLNDPNGLCLVDGVYHVFFQYNPNAAVHDAIHWGHVSSTDLYRWRPEPLALIPRREGPDAAGCWSGCVVDDHGVPTAVYTGVPDRAENAGVLLAHSDPTLRTWQQSADFVVGTPADPAISDVRDPYVFSYQGHRYAVQGAGHRLGRPRLLLYGCDDLEHWTELGPLLTDDDPVAAEVAPANIWECPNLALVDGRWVLIVSLWRWRDETHELAGVRYLLGDLVPDGEGLRFRASSGGLVDQGPACYAPQLLRVGDRTLLWGWAWEIGRSAAEVETAGWAGVLTFPRELYLREERLCCRPAAELAGLRREPLAWRPGVGFVAPAFELRASGPARLLLRTGTGTTLVSEVHGRVEDPARVLVDGSIVESFVAGTATTTRSYPSPTSTWVVEADPAAVSVTRLSLGADRSSASTPAGRRTTAA
jgi:beta-fructofuranosidase